MLDRYFMYPGVLRRMRQGPLRGEIDTLAETLGRTGYTRRSARRYLSLIASFSRYASRLGCRSPLDIDRALVERFVRRRSWSRSTATVARTALGHVLRHGQWAPPPVRRSPGERRDAAVLADFDHYLETTRGLEVKSRDELVRAARRLLAWYRQARPRRALACVSAKDVLAYAAYVTPTCAAHRTRSAAMFHLRNFVRYLRWCGVLQDDLARVVPRVPIWPLADLPDALAWPDVRRVIEAIDGTDAVSRRDRALVWLVATTGMRNGEIRRLELSDIQWRTGDIHLRRTKNRRERRVPLLPEAGRALAEYLLQGRPPTTERRIFLSHQPPVRPSPSVAPSRPSLDAGWPTWGFDLDGRAPISCATVSPPSWCDRRGRSRRSPTCSAISGSTRRPST
jgi:integrase/recombinase XerD